MQKVLMIDNAKLMHLNVKARLADDELEFHSAYGGDEGLAAARELRPDVILLDIDMPHPDGFEVCRRLKADPDLSNIQVIFLTATTSTEKKIEGLGLGAVDYVTKPCDTAELQARVRASLRTKYLLDLLSTRAMIDGLTGQWNRAFLDDRLEPELARAQRYGTPLSCVMADVDHFKAVNDTHGHAFGDVVLRGVGQSICAGSRAEDLVCRYGGEEFVILAPGVDARAAATLAERLRMTIAERQFARNGVTAHVTCSFGVADVSGGHDTLLERADKALYAAKTAGRNLVVTDATPAVKGAA